jgi:dolichol-phosphate mannosyltransferase
MCPSCACTPRCTEWSKHSDPRGRQRTRGAWIVTLDGDGQDDPSDIPRLLRKRVGADGNTTLFAGWRVNRQGSGSKRLASRWANVIGSRLLRDDTPDTGSGKAV